MPGTFACNEANSSRALPQILLHLLLPTTAAGACKHRQSAVPSTAQVCALLPARGADASALPALSAAPKLAASHRGAEQLWIAVKLMKIRWFSALTGWSKDTIPCPLTGTGAVTKLFGRCKQNAAVCSPWSVAPEGPGVTSQLPRNPKQEKQTEDQILLCMWAPHLCWNPRWGATK